METDKPPKTHRCSGRSGSRLPSSCSNRSGTPASARTIHLVRQAQRVLREQLLARPAGAGYVFCAPTGLLWNKDNFDGRVWRPALKRGEFPQFGFHSIRHTYATLMIEAGTHMQVLQSLTGH